MANRLDRKHNRIGKGAILGVTLFTLGAIASIVFCPPLALVYTVAIAVGGPLLGAGLGACAGLAHDRRVEKNEEEMEDQSVVHEEDDTTRIDDDLQFDSDEVTENLKKISTGQWNQKIIKEFLSESRGQTIGAILKLAKKHQELILNEFKNVSQDLSDGLKKAASERIKEKFKKICQNPLAGKDFF